MSTSNQTPGSLSEKVFVAEAVSPSHPDKIADRIAGALIDLTYQKAGLDFTRADDADFAEKFAEITQPKAAFEILIGHGQSQIIAETSVHLEKREVDAGAWRSVFVNNSDLFMRPLYMICARERRIPPDFAHVFRDFLSPIFRHRRQFLER